jgi:hypothetical protein
MTVSPVNSNSLENSALSSYFTYSTKKTPWRIADGLTKASGKSASMQLLCDFSSGFPKSTEIMLGFSMCHGGAAIRGSQASRFA